MFTTLSRIAYSWYRNLTFHSRIPVGQLLVPLHAFPVEDRVLQDGQVQETLRSTHGTVVVAEEEEEEEVVI